MTFEIMCPMYRDKRGEIQNTFSYSGVLLSICFDTILKENNIIESDDELVGFRVVGGAALIGTTIEIETLYVDSMKLIIIDKQY